MRTFKRKISRGFYSPQQLNNAAKAEESVITAAEKKIVSERFFFSMGYAAPRQVFSPMQEDCLKKYLLQIASIFYGYFPRDGWAVEFNIKSPVS